MKKYLLGLSVLAFMLTSCGKQVEENIVTSTARTEPVRFEIIGGAVQADLDVSTRKIEYTYIPTDDVRRGGEDNVLNTAVREALRKNGGGDILVEMQTTITKGKSNSGFLTGKYVIKSVTVTGYPATYKNFRSVTQ